MSRKKKQDVINTVPVECPRCGRTGHARIARLDRAFVCRACQARFYIDHTGSRVVGEPPKSSKTLEKERDRERERQEWEWDPEAALPSGRGARLAAAVRVRWRAAVFRWSQVPSWGRVAVVVGPLLVLAGAYFAWTRGQAPDYLPSSLPDRARFVGEAFVRDDGGGLRAIAAGWSGGAAADWMGQKRPESWPDVDVASPAQVDVKITFQNEAAKEAAVIVTAYRPGGAFDGAAADGQVELRTYWTLGDDGLWYLDGEKTRARAE